MSLKELLLHKRLIAITFAIGGIVLYIWAQLTFETLVRNAFMTGYMVVALATMLAFAFASTLLLVKLGAVGLKQKFMHRGLLALVLLSSVLSMIVYMFITDTAFGPSIRSMFNLPHGNLFVTGGRVGWTFAFLLAIIVICVVKFKNVGEKLETTLNREAPLPARKKTVSDVAELDPPEREDVTSTMPSDNGGVSDLESMFPNR